LSVAEAARNAAFVTEAIEAALDDLLAAGRTSSLQRWIAAARATGAEGGLIDYAESEALLRVDELDRAMALATQAAGSLDGDLAARAHLVAGRSAHLTDRSPRTNHHADLAAAFAESAETREGALWLRLISAYERQSPDLIKRLEDFRSSAEMGLRRSLMVAAGELCIAVVEGGLADALDDARGVLALTARDADPIAHTSFLSAYSYALVASARYEEARKITDTLTSVAESYAIEFPFRFAQLYRAKALIGLRKFAPAGRTLSMLERRMQNEPESYFHGNLPVERARLYASVGDLTRAMDVLSLGPPERASEASRSEFLGWQALLHALARDSGRANALVRDARQAGRGMEVNALSTLVQAVVALNDERQDRAATHFRTVIETGLWDPVVIAIRAAPKLGRFIADEPQCRSWLQRLLVASRDGALATSLGLRVPRVAKERSVLSPRETEVHELLAQGLTNEEIASLLYISLSTTKVHVKHIYDKLGVRSRLEAARALRDDV
jgi:ATP/maltotriose-dependent transcriptional regulator MalT